MSVAPGWLLEAAGDVVANVAGERAVAGIAAELEACWGERHRAWHGPSHLLALLQGFASHAERETLKVAALWHDAIYDPTRNDNEERSAELLRRHASDADRPLIQRAMAVILASKWVRLPSDPLTRAFFDLDTYQLSENCPFAERALYERAIFREYQFASWPKYRAKRAEFLREWAKRFPEHASGCSECLDLLATAAPRLAIYPGSFNPFHLGHLSVLRQAERSFDKVIIAVGINRQKSMAPDAELNQRMNDRCERVRNQLRFHEVVSFEGLLTELVASFEESVTVVRGVRDGTDLEAELRFARFLRDLRPETNVLWIGCDAELQHVSSSAIRELSSIQPAAGERYIPSASEVYGLAQTV